MSSIEQMAKRSQRVVALDALSDEILPESIICAFCALCGSLDLLKTRGWGGLKCLHLIF